MIFKLFYVVLFFLEDRENMCLKIFWNICINDYVNWKFRFVIIVFIFNWLFLYYKFLRYIIYIIEIYDVNYCICVGYNCFYMLWIVVIYECLL